MCGLFQQQLVHRGHIPTRDSENAGIGPPCTIRHPSRAGIWPRCTIRRPARAGIMPRCTIRRPARAGIMPRCTIRRPARAGLTPRCTTLRCSRAEIMSRFTTLGRSMLEYGLDVRGPSLSTRRPPTPSSAKCRRFPVFGAWAPAQVHAPACARSQIDAASLIARQVAPCRARIRGHAACDQRRQDGPFAPDDA